MNFILGCRSQLEIYVPILSLAQELDIKCRIFYRDSSNYYLNPTSFLAPIKQLCLILNTDLLEIKEVINYPGITFLVEGDLNGKSESAFKESGLHYLDNTHIKICLTQNCNFIPFYNKYIDLVDYVIFPSKTYATHNNLISIKNIYLGNPKYSYPCFKLTNDQIYNKYGLSRDNKYLLFFTPKSKFRVRFYQTGKVDYCFGLYKYLMKQTDYKIIVKTRSNTIDDKELRGDYYFADYQLFPNISVELLQIADIAIMFSSCANEECIITKTPYLQFEFDQEYDRFTFLNDDSFSRVLDFNYSYENIKKMIDELVNKSDKRFDQIQLKYMYNINDSARNIIDFAQKITPI